MSEQVAGWIVMAGVCWACYLLGLFTQPMAWKFAAWRNGRARRQVEADQRVEQMLEQKLQALFEDMYERMDRTTP